MPPNGTKNMNKANARTGSAKAIPRVFVIPASLRTERHLYFEGVKKRLRLAVAAVAASALASCGVAGPDRAEREAWDDDQAAAPAPAPAPPPAPPHGPLDPDPPGTRWETAASGEGASLVLLTPAGERHLTLFCRPRSGEVVVNVPRFSPVAGQELLSFGAAGRTLALIADPRGDAERGGVSALTPVTEELSQMLTSLEPMSAGYASQTSGPHVEMAPEIARGFLAACRAIRG